MSIEETTTGTWKKGAGRQPTSDGDYVYLVVPHPESGVQSVQMPEWLADVILANRSTLDATLTRAQTAEAALAEAKALNHHLMHGDMVRTTYDNYVCALNECTYHKDDLSRPVPARIDQHPTHEAVDDRLGETDLRQEYSEALGDGDLRGGRP